MKKSHVADTKRAFPSVTNISSFCLLHLEPFANLLVFAILFKLFYIINTTNNKIGNSSNTTARCNKLREKESKHNNKDVHKLS